MLETKRIRKALKAASVNIQEGQYVPLDLAVNICQKLITESYPEPDKQNPLMIDLKPGQNSQRNKAVRILDYLNVARKELSTNKNVRGFQFTDSIKTVIQARLKEGHSVDDFKQIIDYKCHDWKGTTYEKYLRPSTLFRASKFPEYLVESETFKKPELSALDKQISGLMEN